MFGLRGEPRSGRSFPIYYVLLFKRKTFLIWLLFPLIANMLTSGDTCCLRLLNFNADQSKEHYGYLKRPGVMHFRLTVKEKLFKKAEVHFAVAYSMLLFLLSVGGKKWNENSTSFNFLPLLPLDLHSGLPEEIPLNSEEGYLSGMVFKNCWKRLRYRILCSWPY